ncbi:MAG: recombination-associated protein RdgC [Myxococcota bacterium]
MGVMSGAMTVARFRVLGELPSGWREAYRDKLNQYAFREPPNGMGKEEVEGWVQVHNLLDTTFDDFNRWLYDEVALFALRVDKKRLPAKLFKATLDKRCQAWAAEREVERVPTAIRQEIKDELEHEWLARTLPTVATTEAAWHLGQGWLLIHSLSETVADRYRKRFFRTFGLKLIPWSPLDFLNDRHLVEDLLSKAPSPVQLGVHLAAGTERSR